MIAIMDAKEYLRSIKRMDVMINGMVRERDQLRGMRYKITQVLNPVKVSGGGTNEGFTGASDRLLDLEEEINREVDRFADLKQEAGEMLKRLEDPKHYEVLHKHYILYESFEKIAVDMGCTYRNACYLHGRALQVFQRVMDKHGC